MDLVTSRQLPGDPELLGEGSTLRPSLHSCFPDPGEPDTREPRDASHLGDAGGGLGRAAPVLGTGLWEPLHVVATDAGICKVRGAQAAATVPIGRGSQPGAQREGRAHGTREGAGLQNLDCSREESPGEAQGRGREVQDRPGSMATRCGGGPRLGLWTESTPTREGGPRPRRPRSCSGEPSAQMWLRPFQESRRPVQPGPPEQHLLAAGAPGARGSPRCT